LEDVVDFGAPVQLRGTFTDQAFESEMISTIEMLENVQRSPLACPRWSLRSRRGEAESVVATGRRVSETQTVVVPPPPAFVSISEAFVHGGECRYADKKPDIDTRQALNVVKLFRNAKQVVGGVDNFGDDNADSSKASFSAAMAGARLAATVTMTAVAAMVVCV
jgi:hypothetical protein